MNHERQQHQQQLDQLNSKYKTLSTEFEEVTNTLNITMIKMNNERQEHEQLKSKYENITSTLNIERQLYEQCKKEHEHQVKNMNKVNKQEYEKLNNNYNKISKDYDNINSQLKLMIKELNEKNDLILNLQNRIGEIESKLYLGFCYILHRISLEFYTIYISTIYHNILQ